jgi:hypothetical protein
LSASNEIHQYTICRADGEDFGEDFRWALATDETDWAWAENDEHDEPTEYVIEKWVRVGEWRRTFGEPIADEDDDESPGQ